MDFLHDNFCPLRFILSLATSEYSPAPFSSLSPIMCLNTSRLNSPISLSLFFYMRCSEALTTFIAPHWTCCSMSMSPHNGETRTRLSMSAVSHQGWADGNGLLTLQSCFTAGLSQPCWYLELFFCRSETLPFLCWTSWGSCQPFPQACQSPSGQQCNHQLYQLLPPILYLFISQVTP